MAELVPEVVAEGGRKRLSADTLAAIKRLQAVLGHRREESVEIVYSIAMEAFSKFWLYHPEDFCIQHMAEDRIVFGGTNRIIWTVAGGFFVDPKYCTAKFLETYSTWAKNNNLTGRIPVVK